MILHQSNEENMFIFFNIELQFSVQEWCDKYKFSNKIYQKLIELEFTSTKELKILPNDDIIDLCKELKIKFGVKGRFLNAIDDLKVM